MIYAMAILPLMASLFIGIGKICTTLTKSTRHLSSCVRTGFGPYDKISTATNSLFKLNTKAKKLRADYHRARAQLLAAIATGNPARIGYCEMRLGKVEIARSALDVEQKHLIAQIQYFQNDLVLHSRRLNGFRSIQVGDLTLHPDVPGDIAPAYSFKDELPETSKTTIHYQVFKNPSMCSVRLQKRGGIYRATLSQNFKLTNSQLHKG